MENNEVFDWKRYRLGYNEKAQEILDTLSLKEKVFLMSGAQTTEQVRAALQKKSNIHYNEEPYQAGGICEKNIPPMKFVDGTRGVVCGRGTATCFPVSVMRGATFSPILEEQIGEAIGEEVLEAGGNLFGGVCVNLPYHPGWGRAQETYGEDTFLLGEMGSALVRGVQNTGVIACVKHFAFNSMENLRFDVNITCLKRTEREVFLNHFKKCIDAGAGAVMSAYNSYKGTMCGHNAYLLRQVLKKEWGFDGFVMSDFNWGLKDTIAAVTGGLDMEMPNTNYYGDNLIKAVQNKKVPEAVVNQAALRIVRTLLAHNDKIEYLKTVDYQAHRNLALKCAREGITLLRNENKRLPLKIDQIEKIVVLGELADKENTGDKGSSQVYTSHVTTMLEGVVGKSSESEVIYYGGDSTSHCRRLAKEADAIIIVAGNTAKDEGEYTFADNDMSYVTNMGGDRNQGLGLGSRDLSIIGAVADVRQDAIVVLYGGSTITMAGWHEQTGAILLVYYPGMEGGTALSEILFGESNPSGKLPFVIPEKEQNLQEIQWDEKEQFYEYFHGYTRLEYLDIKPLYPFGFGLSYTDFSIDETWSVWKDDTRLYASVRICNIGNMAGAEVLQMYVGLERKIGEVTEIQYPKKSLKAFSKIYLDRGQGKNVILSCEIKELRIYDEKNDGFVLESGVYRVYVGNSSAAVMMKEISIIY